MAVLHNGRRETLRTAPRAISTAQHLSPQVPKNVSRLSFIFGELEKKLGYLFFNSPEADFFKAHLHTTGICLCRLDTT